MSTTPTPTLDHAARAADAARAIAAAFRTSTITADDIRAGDVPEHSWYLATRIAGLGPHGNGYHPSTATRAAVIAVLDTLECR